MATLDHEEEKAATRKLSQVEVEDVDPESRASTRPPTQVKRVKAGTQMLNE